MRLLLVRNSQLLRRHASSRFAKHSLAEVASPTDINRRLLSSFNRSSAGANRTGPICAAGGHLLLKSTSNPLPMLQFVRHCRARYRGWQPKADVSSEIWQLLNEYDVPATIKRVYSVYIETAETTSKQVQLLLHGRDASKTAEMLGACLRGVLRADPPLKLDVHDRFDSWLLGEGSNGLRIKNIQIISGALVKLSQNRKSVLLVGPSKATLEAKRMIDECDCVEEFDIDNYVGFYLINNNASNQKRLSVETDTFMSVPPVFGATKWRALVVGPQESVKRLRSKLDGLHVKRRQIPQIKSLWLKIPGKRAKRARLEDLERKFETGIEPGPHKDDSDPYCLVDLTVVGELEQNVDDVLAIMDGLHVRRRRTQQAIRSWLLKPSKAAERVRSFELSWKLDTFIHSGPLNDKDDPDCMVDLTVVGEREENVNDVLAIIDGLCIKRRQIPQITSLWLRIPGKGADCVRLTGLERKFDTFIVMWPHSDDNDPARLVDLTVVGELEKNVDDVLAIIDGPCVKRRQIPLVTALWLKIPGKGASCARLVDLQQRFDTCTMLGPVVDDIDPARLVDLAVVGEREENVDHVLTVIDGIHVHVKRRRIQRAVRSWLASPGKGAERARSIDLSRKFDALIHSGPLNDNDEPDCMFDLAVAGEREENVDDVLAIIDSLHVTHSQLPRAVCWWLINTRNGAKQDRRADLDWEFDTRVYIRPLNGDIDPTRMESFAAVGECKDNVDQILASIGSIVVETVNVAKDQAEIWTGHEDNQNQPHHELEDTTDTHIVWDEGAGCLHVSGRPEGVNEAVKRIREFRLLFPKKPTICLPGERLDTPPSSGSGS